MNPNKCIVFTFHNYNFEVLNYSGIYILNYLHIPISTYANDHGSISKYVLVIL